MSIHRDETICHSINQGQVWTAVCACGWRGADHPTSTEPKAAATADYREHVEAALGANAYYHAPVACRNCGSMHEQGVLVGTAVVSATCVRCGTTMLSPDNEAWREAKERQP